MNSKYIASLVATIFFSVTTILIFITTGSGAFLRYFPEPLAWFVILLNFGLLVVSSIIFYVQRSRKEAANRRSREIIETYASKYRDKP